MTTFHINKDVPFGGILARTVEADSYGFADGYFHFYTYDGGSDVTVFSINANRVEIIEADKD